MQVGDYINYEPDPVGVGYSNIKLSAEITGSTKNIEDIVQEDLDWKILKIYNDGSIDLIGNSTNQEIFFQGAEGYNNGVYVLNDICKELYSRGDLKARSICWEDFEANISGQGKKEKNEHIAYVVNSLTTGTYISNVDTQNNAITYIKDVSYYLNLYGQENGSGIDTNVIKKDGMKESETLKDIDGNPTYDVNKGINAYKHAENNGLTVSYTYYGLATNEENYGKAAEVLKENYWYWVASRCVGVNMYNAQFGLRYATEDALYSSYLFISDTSVQEGNNRLRPIIHLGSKTKIEPCKGENSASNTHIITKY